MSTDSGEQIAKLMAKMFIARPDVKAIQRNNGEYNPVKSRITKDDLLAHQRGEVTYGHYLLNEDSQCKLFAFDIDLDEPDPKNPKPSDAFLTAPTEVAPDGVWNNFQVCNPRDVWRDRSKVIARNFFKFQMRYLAGVLAAAIQKEFEIQTAVAYSGAKGVHVYGFTGLLPAADVRDGAILILNTLGVFDLVHGQSFYKHKKVSETASDSPDYGMEVGQIAHDFSLQQLTVEVFPKQTTISAGGYGNLMRLPLGKNLKNPQDPTFFMDMRGNLGSGAFIVRNPVDALTAKNQWA